MRKNKCLKLLMFCLLMLFVTGCQNNTYERDSTQGEIRKITLSQMEEMFVQEKTFAIMLTQSMCGYCKDFHNVLEEYQKNHHIIMYEVVLDDEPATVQENVRFIERYIDDFSTTPGVFYIKYGETKSHLEGDASGISKEMLEAWVIEHQLDKKQ